MLDLKEECSVSLDQTSQVGGESMKRCTDCQTTTTPLWRGGPAGPKSLCNACGIKYHKRRRALLGLDKGKVDKTKKKSKSSSGSNSSSGSSSSSNNNNNNIGMPLKIKVMTSGIRRQRENLEVEQAAMLLMALSYGSVYG